MANKDHFTESLDDFNPYYTPYYDSDNGKNSKSPSSRDKKSKSDQKNSEGKNLLRRAENSSANPLNRNQGETNSPWKNSVQGKPLPTISSAKNIKTTIKNRRPGIALLVILLLLVGGGVFLSSTHTLLPAALESLITEATDTQYASNTARIVQLTSYMLQADNATTSTWSGLTRYTKMSSSFKSRLAKNNITIDGSGKNTILNFKQIDANGVERITPIKADEFAQTYRDNPEFRNAYTKAKRGRVAGFFDDVANRVMTHLGLSRNVFKDSKATSDTEVSRTEYDEIMRNQTSNNNSSADTGGVIEENKIVYETNEDGSIATDQNGNPIPATRIDENGNRVPITTDEWDKSNVAQSNVKDSVDAETKASNYVSNIASSFSKYTKAANTICTIRKIGNMVAAVASATELYNSIKIAAPANESISKMKAGYGSTSKINETMSDFTTPVETTIEDYSKISSNGESIGTTTTTKSAVENSVLQWILSGGSSGTLNPNVAANFSLERIGTALTSALRMSPTELEICNGIRTANALVSIAVTIGTFGVSTIGSLILNFTVSLSTAVIASTLLGFLIPTLAKTLFTNTWEYAKGDVFGAIYTRGTFSANSRLGRSGSGQSPSSTEAILAYNKINNEVLALDAEVDRLNRSPFDITSKNTFLGSIAYSLLPTILSGSTNAVHTVIRTTSKSLASLTSSVYAEGEGSSYTTTFGNCPALEALGVRGDVFCNPITTTDNSTINLSPSDAKYITVIAKQVTCDDNGTCSINDGSSASCDIEGNCNLARYIKYCSQRDSQFGIIDTNILSEMETGGIVLNSIPLIGDVLDLVNAAEQEVNIGWASGLYCSNTPENTKWNEEMRYYQRYIQDMRLLDQIGEGSNPVTAFLEEYYAKNPLDNSQAGYIARISGISKDDAETLIAIAESYQFLQNYDSSTRIAMTEENTTVQSAESVIARFENDKIDFSEGLESETSEEIFLAKQSEQYIIYADLRNRSFAA